MESQRPCRSCKQFCIRAVGTSWNNDLEASLGSTLTSVLCNDDKFGCYLEGNDEILMDFN